MFNLEYDQMKYNTLSMVLIGLFLIYMTLTYTHRNEGFQNLEQPASWHSKYFDMKYGNDEIFDEFYSFYYGSFHHNHQQCEKTVNILDNYIGNVYNNHLIVGEKHGGHYTALSQEIVPSRMITTHENIVKRCKFNYPSISNKFTVVSETEMTNPFLFNQSEFTHISVIDNEIYTFSDIYTLINNLYEWNTHKGYVFVEVFNDKRSFLQTFENKSTKNYDTNSQINFFYDSRLQMMQADTLQSQENYNWIETIRFKNKQRKHFNNITFYSNDVIKAICNNIGLSFINQSEISRNKSILIFQKTQ
jgi:hypothetical protein